MLTNSKARYLLWIGIITLAVPILIQPAPAFAQNCSDPNVVCLFATNVPAVCGWDYESQAQGSPSTALCDDGSTPPPYAVQSIGFVDWGTNCDNNGGACSADFSCSCGSSLDCECFLEATQFNNFAVPAGMTIKSVLVDVQCRYNHSTAQCNADAGKIRVRAQLPSLSRTTTIDSAQFSNADGNCRYRLGASGDITSNTDLAVGTWTADLVNDLQVAVRRIEDNGKNTALRVNAFRIIIVLCQDCNGDGICDSCEGQPDGTPCESDQNACTSDVCAGQCCRHNLISCTDGNPCTDDSCNPATGCVFQPNSAPCDDHNVCTAGDHCAGGACQPGTPINCSDGNPCTDDLCNPATGCVFQPNSAPCDDRNACTLNDSCSGGACQPGTARICNDNNPCTDDSCNLATGCVYQPNSAPCDDHNACTAGDRCGGGTCVPGNHVACFPVSQCFEAFCDSVTGCVQEPWPSGTPCDDGNACTVGDMCDGAGNCHSGQPKQCDDGNPCTDNLCDPATGCKFVNNTASCSDGSVCTVGDRCNTGACQPGQTISCDDGNPCTTDSCDPSSGCKHANNTLPCDDHNPCTANDTCSNGSCVGHNPLCDDANPCTDDSCDPNTGCRHVNNTAPCSDGNACTVGDSCSGGSCHPGLALNCDDGNLCTTDSCDTTSGCKHVNNTIPCDDHNACTDGDHCSGGSCQSGSPRNCDDGNVCTDDSCDAGSGCQHVNNTIPCNDGHFCTVGDRCSGGTCQSGTPRNCADGNPCTADPCDDNLAQCRHVNLNSSVSCDDGQKCTTNDHCDGAGHCVGQPVICPDDGLFCSGVEICKPDSGVCGPGGNPCTGTTPVCCEEHRACVQGCSSFGYDLDGDGDVDLRDYYLFTLQFDGPL